MRLSEKLERQAEFPQDTQLLINYLIGFNEGKKIIDWFEATRYIDEFPNSLTLADISSDGDGKIKSALVDIVKRVDKCIKRLELGMPVMDDDDEKEFDNYIVAFHNYFNGEAEEVAVPFEWESAGTKRLLSNIAPYIFRTLEMGSLLIVDELDNSLHPYVAIALIQLFHTDNPNNAQLIFSTHSTFSMSKNYLRAEELCFTEKDDRGFSSVKSVYDYYEDDPKKVYKRENWGEDYLQGIYVEQPNMSMSDFSLD